MKRRSRRRRTLWAVAAAVTLLVLTVILIGGTPQAAPPALGLPSATTITTGKPRDGTWAVGPGSVAGFRLSETTLGREGDVAGRTNQISGTATVTGDRITAAECILQLDAITVNGEPSKQFADSLNTADFPTATFTLTAPVDLAAGAAQAPGRLTLHGVTRAVRVTFTSRGSTATVEATGSVPIVLADWGIQPPRGYGSLGSLADHGVAEFYLHLTPA
ncbi:polyisoprenoid-binding protein YceI [Actinoplanes tereljensis]|uniref:YceI family protein n=1 Tax=Paractinoplanes tereljensis TaxID=571912 RepID=UPI001941B856|nr:YceI family protein [Actinoplanes tereljensis]